jgi:mono/diheme cytochrome c family protein
MMRTRIGWLLIWMGISGGVLAACGTTPSAQVTPLPTSTIIPTFNFVQPTAVPALATAAANAAAAGVDPQVIERGRDRYAALACGDCHGANGEGAADGPTLIGYAGSEAEFIAFMRSGGELGAAHQYATNRLSDSGGRNLYQYLLSLAPAS